MNRQTDLISWLSRPHLDHLEALKLSIKVWNSIDYTNVSKYDIIVRYFCNKLPDLCRLGENLNPDSEEFANLWKTIREFVEMKYPIGVVTSETKALLIEALIQNAINLDIVVFSVLKAATQNNSFASFFSSNAPVYGKLMSTCLITWRLILEAKCPTKESQKGITNDLLGNLKGFAQYQANNSTFRKMYVLDIHKPLTELVIFLKTSKIDCKRNFLAIIQEIFFNEESKKWYNVFFEASDKIEDTSEDRLMFREECLHVSLMNIEGFLFTFHGHKDLCGSFIGYLFRDVFVPAKMEFSNLVMGINHTMMLLKSYSIKLSIGKGDFSQKIREILLKIVEEFAESNTRDCLTLVLRTMQLNPLIFIDDLSYLIVKFLFLPKNEEILQTFSQFFAVCLETFHKLSRFEKNLTKLLETIHSAVLSMEFPKKLKRKLKEKCDHLTKRQKLSESGDFLEILTETDSETYKSVGKSESEGWSEFSFAWSEEISQRFSKIILSLMPKASLTVWKSLIYSVLSALDSAKERQFDENSLFFLEFTCKMLYSYFQGSRLLEKPDNILKKIDERQILMKDLFKKFLDTLDAENASMRPLKSFLELYSNILDFNMALVVYRPDFVHEKNVDNLVEVDYLEDSSWREIENKVIEDMDLRDLFYSLQLKRLKVKTVEKRYSEKALGNLSGILEDVTIFRKMTVDLKDGFWIVKSLSRQDKLTLAQLIVGRLDVLHDPKILEIFEDEEFLIIFLLVSFQEISLKINTKKAPFCKINFAKLMSGGTFDDIPDEILPQLKPVNFKGKSPDQDLKDIFDKLKSVPIGFICREEKNKFLFLLLVLLHSLLDYEDLENSLLDILTNLTELGTEIDVFEHISVSKVLEMFPNVEKKRKLYDILFTAAIKWQSEANIKSFAELVTILEFSDSSKSRDLIMIAVEHLSKSKKFHKVEKETMKIHSKITSLALKSFENVQKLDGLLPAFEATLRLFFQRKENLSKTHEDLGMMCLKFINHFRDIQEDQSVDLLKIVVNNRKTLSISHESLMSIVMDFWEQMRKIQGNTSKDSQMANVVLTICKPDGFADVLRILKGEANMENGPYICRMLQSFGCCNMNEDQAKLFSTFYEELMEIISEVCLTSTVGESLELVLDILNLHIIYVKNTKIPLQNSLFHNILTFLVEINLKRLKLDITDFSRIHLQMTKLCHAVIQHRSSCLRFAMPQFVSIFKDLIHGICGYRSERNRNEKLDEDEIETLTQLAHKLELMIAFMASKNKNSKRVAPFLLVFVINEMIYNQNSTTLNPSIKTHINNICYSLIAMCDPKYGQFILRSCSESSRNVYKTLLKEYAKYYKFHGKI